jgi:hypothetical protein
MQMIVPKRRPPQAPVQTLEIVRQVQHEVHALARLHVDADIIRPLEERPEILCITIVPAAHFEHGAFKAAREGRHEQQLVYITHGELACQQ